MQTPLLSIKNLRTYFHLDEGVLKAVDGVDLEMQTGQTLGIIGESGSGKSVMARSVMRLIAPPGRVEAGSQILLNTNDGEPVDIAQLPYDGDALRQIRGKSISMIFQEPMTSLSPVHRVGDQILEAVLLHVTRDKTEARAITLDAIQRVGIPNPERAFLSYPHELSGGLRQRIMIAMALACRPQLLIADEPTTALDVTVQWQILRLMDALRNDLGMAILYITHDLGVVAQIADTVAVMYLGQIVETADVFTIFERPLHPYTQSLLKSIPKVGAQSRQRLEAIGGTVPVPINLPVRCRFADRCQFVKPECSIAAPALRLVDNGHAVRCFLHHQEVEHGR
ncbi:MAG: ABC transporter ATP-binding protein [Chloroflexi bacterium]|nr:ABC transporter ATP-binding protein [Chloroflexota bacterium]